MSVKKTPKKKKGPTKSQRRQAKSKASAPESNWGGTLETLISTAVAGAQAFASQLSHESRARIMREASELVGGILNSESATKLRELLHFWHSGEGADEFGKDATLVDFLRPFFQFMYFNYFRVDVTGSRSIPRKGPAILVANHAGTLPYDGAMVHLAVYNELAGQREVRFLVEDFVYHLPILGTLIERIGGMKANQENAQTLLDAGHLIVVFPEGVKGIGKSYDDRYKLQRFGRGGFVKLAMRTGVPILPVAIVGSEETHPIIWKSEHMGKHVGLPFLPFTPTFPWLGPLGLVPLPSKWKISFGKMHKFDRFKPKDAENENLVNAHADDIKDEIQDMLDDTLAGRKNAWR